MSNKKKNPLNYLLLALLTILIATYLGITLTTRDTSLSTDQTIPLATGNYAKPGDIQGSGANSYSPQQTVKLSPNELNQVSF